MKNESYKKSLKNLINTHLELLSEYEKELLTVSNKEERRKILLGMNHSQEQLTDLIQMWHDEHSNILKGGKGDALNIDEVDQNELRMGMAIEMEHTDDKWIALEIVLDHLAEFPDYYTRLLKMEKEAKKLKSNPTYKEHSDTLNELFKEANKFAYQQSNSITNMTDWYLKVLKGINKASTVKELNEMKRFKTQSEEFDNLISYKTAMIIDYPNKKIKPYIESIPVFPDDESFIKPNPVSWVKDEKIWERAKRVVRKEYSGMMKDLYPIIVKVYKNMGGRNK